MKLLDAKVDWHDGFANAPELQILVDRVPDWNEMRFERRENFFVAYNEGYVCFVHGDPLKPSTGFGGDTFHLKMIDGSEVELIGPWSSRAGAVNSEFSDRPVVDVDITDDPEAFKRGYTFSSGHATVELGLAAAKLAGVELKRCPAMTEISASDWKKQIGEKAFEYYGHLDGGPIWEIWGKHLRKRPKTISHIPMVSGKPKGAR